MDIENREELIYTLGKAAELEHLIICQYLYATFSLKRFPSEGLTAESGPIVTKWARQMLGIAIQEMLHLALVQNLLTSIGAGPHLGRPNFPGPAAGVPGQDPDRAAAAQRGRAAPFRFPRAARGSRHRGCRRDGRARAGVELLGDRRRRGGPDRVRLRDDQPPLPVHRGRHHRVSRAHGRGSAVHRPSGRAGDGRPLSNERAGAGHRPRICQAGDRHDRGAGRGRARRLEAGPFRPAAADARRVPGRSAPPIRPSNRHGRFCYPGFDPWRVASQCRSSRRRSASAAPTC